MAVNINHRQLEAFRAVMKTGSASAAGKVMGITQPATSRLISDLESEVGFKLFERRKRGLQPTAESSLLYEEVERSYRGLEEIRATVEAIRVNQTGRVRMVAMPAYVDGLVARLIGGFVRDHPGLYFELESRATTGIVEGIATDQFDIGIAILPIKHGDIVSEAFAEGQAMCVVPANHHLAKKRFITVHDLADQPFIALSADSPYRPLIQQHLDEFDVELKIVLEMRTQRAICAVVGTGAGVSIIDSHVATEINNEQVVARPLQPIIRWQIGMLTPAKRTPSLALSELMAYFKEHAES